MGINKSVCSGVSEMSIGRERPLVIPESTLTSLYCDGEGKERKKKKGGEEEIKGTRETVRGILFHRH